MYDYSINEMTLDHNYFEKRIFSNDDYTIPFRPISNVSSNFEINNYYEDLSKKDSNNLELSVKKMNEINDSKIFEDFSINKGMQNVKTNKDNKHNKKIHKMTLIVKHFWVKSINIQLKGFLIESIK